MCAEVFVKGWVLADSIRCGWVSSQKKNSGSENSNASELGDLYVSGSKDSMFARALRTRQPSTANMSK